MKNHFNDITSNRASEPYVVITYGMSFLLHGENGQCSIAFFIPTWKPKKVRTRQQSLKAKQ